MTGKFLISIFENHSPVMIKEMTGEIDRRRDCLAAAGSWILFVVDCEECANESGALGTRVKI